MKSELEPEEILLRRNLSDAGCDGKTMDSIVQMYQSGDISRATTVLNKVRRTLLERVHTEQRKIDALDFLLNKLPRCRARGDRESVNNVERPK